MSDLFDDLFNGEASTEVEEAEQPEAEQETVEQASTDEPVVEEALEPDDADTQEEPVKEPKFVPLSTFLNMRDDMKEAKAARAAAEAEAQEAKARYEALTQQSQAYQPDPLSDPLGYAELVKAEIAQAVFNERLLMSHQNALKAHDAETVAKAVEWSISRANADSTFDAQVQQEADPVNWVIQQHKAASIREAFEADPIAAARKIAEEQGWFAQPAVAQVAVIPTTQKTEKVIPRSLTDVPSANKASTTTIYNDKDELDSIFTSKR